MLQAAPVLQGGFLGAPPQAVRPEAQISQHTQLTGLPCPSQSGPQKLSPETSSQIYVWGVCLTPAGPDFVSTPSCFLPPWEPSVQDYHQHPICFLPLHPQVAEESQRKPPKTVLCPLYPHTASLRWAFLATWYLLPSFLTGPSCLPSTSDPRPQALCSSLQYTSTLRGPHQRLCHDEANPVTASNFFLSTSNFFFLKSSPFFGVPG